VLYRRRELPQFGDLVLADLIEGDEQPSFVLGEEIRLDLLEVFRYCGDSFDSRIPLSIIARK
jgi:hypothetical protein